MEQNDDDNEQLILDETPINEELLKSIESYTLLINKFKYDLYSEYIQNDETHSANDKAPLFKYQGIYLQILGYWIGILDHLDLLPPKLDNSSQLIQNEMTELTQQTIKFYEDSTESRTLAYNVLLKKSTEPPFFFIRSI